MINENELELIVSKKSLGELTTNAIVIKDKVKNALVNFKAENYNEDNIDKAKDDKALLNKTSKKLNDDRIALENEFMKPFEEFKTTIKETTDLIKMASINIDEIVKEVENKSKEEKKNIIISFYEDNVKELKDLITFDNLFNEKWLNKTYKIEDIQNEIKDSLSKICNDLSVITTLKSKYEVELKNEYLNNGFQLGLVIKKNSDLLEKEKLLSTAKVEEQVEENKIEKMNAEAEKVILNIDNDLMTFKLEITGTESQLIALRKFIDTNNMKYKKI